MTDRELLELAAKAAGLEIDFADALTFGGDSHLRYFDKTEHGDWWNPLHVDGDALRLAVKLGICIEFGYCADDAPVVRCGWLEDREHWPQDPNFPDPNKATRRAIVRAAAEIGRASPPTQIAGEPTP